MHACNLCDKSFSSKSHRKRHQESTHQQSVGFSCQVCNKQFYRKDHLKKHHTRKHPDKKYEIPSSYTCHICRKSFHYQDNYRKHMKTHQPTVPAAPPSGKPEEPVHDLHNDSLECPPNLTASLAEEPPPKNIEKHVCNLCGKSFSSKSHLKRHRETTHRQSGSFSCKYAANSFTEKTI